MILLDASIVCTLTTDTHSPWELKTRIIFENGKILARKPNRCLLLFNQPFGPKRTVRTGSPEKFS